jgi:hypothetical protein
MPATKTIDRDEGDARDESKNKDALFCSLSPSSHASLLKRFSFAFSSLRGWICAHRLIGRSAASHPCSRAPKGRRVGALSPSCGLRLGLLELLRRLILIVLTTAFSTPGMRSIGTGIRVFRDSVKIRIFPLIGKSRYSAPSISVSVRMRWLFLARVRMRSMRSGLAS